MADVQTPAGVHRSFPVVPIARVWLTDHEAWSHVVESGAFLCTILLLGRAGPYLALVGFIGIWWSVLGFVGL